jgi:type IV pilus assembly protein PilB
MLASQIIDHLVAGGKLSEAAATELAAAALRGEDVTHELLERKVITDAELLNLRGKLLGLPVVQLVGRDIVPAVLETLPQHLAKRYQAVIYEREAQQALVGLVDPTDQRAVEGIEFYVRDLGLSVRYAVIDPASFRAAFRQYPGAHEETEAAIVAAKEQLVQEVVSAQTGPDDLELAREIERAPVSKIVSTIIRHAIEANASDIHIEPFGKETRIRYRVDGVLRGTLTLPIALHEPIVSRIKVLARLKLDESRVPQDGRIHVVEGTREVDLRVSSLPLLDHEKVVMRVLETSEQMLTLQDLGFRDWQINSIERAVKRPHGMVLLTGPTGSGKSTTLYAVLNLLNAEGVNITTLEDPIEYYVSGVNQAQIRQEVGFSFAAGLRAILRQDPNVIMVGEIRDTETAELAIHAGLTGHLLFSTLHTRDVFGVPPRLIDMKIEPFLLSSTLILGEAQRLVRKICPECREQVVPKPDVLKEIERLLADFPANSIPPEIQRSGITLMHGKGCPRCGGSGYRGRTVVVEILEFDDDFEQMILKGFPAEEARALARERGNLTLFQDALLKALEGITTYEEVLRVSHE